MSFQTVPVTTASAASEAPKPVITQDIKTVKEMANPAGTNEPAKVDAPKVEEKKEDSFSERFASLTKKEKRILKEKEEAKTLREAISKREVQINQAEENIKKFEELKKSNPLKALELLGLSYNDLTQYALNQDEPTPEFQAHQVKKELEEFKRQQQEEKEQLLQEQKKKAEEEETQAISQFKDAIKFFTDAKPDEYELINLFDQAELVYATIQEYFDSKQKVLTVKEGSDLVEKYLEGELERISKAKKFQSKYAPQPQQEKSLEANQSKEQPRTSTQPRTLTNDMSSTTAPAGFLSPRTEAERIQRAMAALDRK